MKVQTVDFLVRLMLTLLVFWPIPLLFFSVIPLAYILSLYIVVGFVIFTPPPDGIARRYLPLWWVVYTWYEYFQRYHAKGG